MTAVGDRVDAPRRHRCAKARRRYFAVPSQATAYKVGALTIQRLRKEAEQQLGPKFDIREFHAQVLDTGALPMKILEAKIHRWIAAKKAS